MKKLLNLALFGLSTLYVSPNALAEKAPFDVKIGKKYNFDSITITSRTDNLTILDVIVNRGQCRFYYHEPQFAHKRPPKTLNFSHSVEFLYRCDFLEITVETDQGTWTFENNN